MSHTKQTPILKYATAGLPNGSPAGTIVYNTDESSLNYYNGSGWETSTVWDSTYTTVSALSSSWQEGASTGAVFALANPVLTTGTETFASLIFKENNTGYTAEGFSVDGNSRGPWAVDLQGYRTFADQVAGGTQSAILGGGQNKIWTGIGVGASSAAYSVIMGGSSNTIYGQYGTILGGNSNEIGDGINKYPQHGIACGFRAKSLHNHTFVWCGESSGPGLSSKQTNTFNIAAPNGLRLVHDTNDHTDEVLTCIDADGHGKWQALSADDWNSTYTTVSSNSASWGAGITAVVEDTAPELGGDLKIANGLKILDQYDKKILEFEQPFSAGTAVNHFKIKTESAGVGPSLKAVGPSISDTVDLNLQPSGAGVVRMQGSIDLNNQKIKSLDKDLITPISNGSTSHISIMSHMLTNDPQIGVISTNTNQGLTINAKGTGNIKLGNLPFDADQTKIVGAGQDNYILTYDHSLGSISLEASTFTETITATTHTQVVDTTHNLYNDDTPGALINVTLLAPESHKGETTHMKIGSTADVVLTPTSGTINGASSYTLATQYQAVKVFSDGTNYFAMA